MSKPVGREKGILGFSNTNGMVEKHRRERESERTGEELWASSVCVCIYTCIEIPNIYFLNMKTRLQSITLNCFQSSFLRCSLLLVFLNVINKIFN